MQGSCCGFRETTFMVMTGCPAAREARSPANRPVNPALASAGSDRQIAPPLRKGTCAATQDIRASSAAA